MPKRRGVHVNIPDTVRRVKHGNQFEVGARTSGPRFYVDDDQQRVGASLYNGRACPNRNTGFDVDIGRAEGRIDGVGVNYRAHGLTSNIALGPVDIGSELATAEAGAKLWQPGEGLDAGFKANATLAQVRAGPVSAKVGVGADTGVRCGKNGVGLKFLGTGFDIRGDEASISIPGFGCGLKWK